MLRVIDVDYKRRSGNHCQLHPLGHSLRLLYPAAVGPVAVRLCAPVTLICGLAHTALPPSIHRMNARRGTSVRVPCTCTGNPNSSGRCLACRLM